MSSFVVLTTTSATGNCFAGRCFGDDCAMQDDRFVVYSRAQEYGSNPAATRIMRPIVGNLLPFAI